MMERLPSYLLPFFSLSYPTTVPKNPDSFPDSRYFNTGRQDLCLMVTYIAIMAILRDTLRLGIFEPFARWKLSRDLRHRKIQEAMKSTRDIKHNGEGHRPLNGKLNGNGHTANGIAHPTPKELRHVHRSVLRFAEQGWSVVYYTLQWSFGLYIHRNLPTRILDPTDVWTNYPHIPLAAPVKIYYLTQTAFYIHQILIINAEARRKDHAQMMTHHVITVFLMITSYFGNFTRIGCLITVIMDWCDIILPLAKMIRYIEISQLACDLTFAWFLISWFITRHILFVFAIVSTIRDPPGLVPFEWSVERGLYMIKSTWIVFISLLVALQVLQIIWFGMICRVAWRTITTDKGASDVRSDDESDNQAKEE